MKAPQQELSELRANAEIAMDRANRFLSLLGEGYIEAIYLVGSRASGKERPDSDWDFLIVGEDFDVVERERIERNYWLGVKPGTVDIIFSSSPPEKEQPHIKISM